MGSIVAKVFFIVLAIGMGVAQGIQSDRWQSSPVLQEALDRLPTLPMDVGDWVADDQPLDAADLLRGGIQGHIHRRYTNRKTEQTVLLLIVCGRGGPISVHTPDICYAGAGYDTQVNIERKTVRVDKSSGMQFWAAQFAKKNAAVPSKLEIYWSWFHNQKWEAPDQARVQFGREKALYKVYVVRNVPPNAAAEKDEDNPTRSFIREVLPLIAQHLSRQPGT